MNHILIIIDEDETEVVKLHIGSINPKRAAIVVLEALSKEEPKRKTRSDAGKPRASKAE